MRAGGGFERGFVGGGRGCGTRVFKEVGEAVLVVVGGGGGGGTGRLIFFVVGWEGFEWVGVGGCGDW